MDDDVRDRFRIDVDAAQARASGRDANPAAKPTVDRARFVAVRSSDGEQYVVYDAEKPTDAWIASDTVVAVMDDE
jgi:hypothetical protein